MTKSGNTRIKLTCIQLSYRPSEISVSSVKFIRVYSVMSCRHLPEEARSLALKTKFRYIIFLPKISFAFLNCCLTLDGVTKYAKFYLSISYKTFLTLSEIKIINAKLS